MKTEHEGPEMDGQKPDMEAPPAKWASFTARPAVNRQVAKPSGHRGGRHAGNVHGPAAGANVPPPGGRGMVKGGGKGRPPKGGRGPQGRGAKQPKLPHGMGDYDDMPPLPPPLPPPPPPPLPLPPTAPVNATEPQPDVTAADAAQQAAPVAVPQPDEAAPMAPQEILPDLHLTSLQKMEVSELHTLIPHSNEEDLMSMRKHDVIFEVIRSYLRRGGVVITSGVLEILPDGFGFLRSPKNSYLQCPEDVYVSPSQVRRFGLRTGDMIEGPVRDPKEKERFFALGRVDAMNGRPPVEARRTVYFENLTPLFPDRRIVLETKADEVSMRVMDLFTPIGFGQRGLIVAPPRTGKTVLLQKISNSISANHPEALLFILLIDERPEEVTDIARSVDGEIIASTFDRPADEHIRVANLALEKAKRLAEAQRDVVILLDSITRLARASNLTVPPSGRTLSGGLDPSGLYFPKRFFGAARNFEEGGSLTIIGTALTDTGSRMDDVIYEEFKGTGNMELHLSRKLAEQRIFPAIDITRSGTRREELLIPEDELSRLWILRKRIVGVDEAGALNLILDKLKQTQTNKDFLMSIKIP